jgi:hypothetical protein
MQEHRAGELDEGTIEAAVNQPFHIFHAIGDQNAGSSGVGFGSAPIWIVEMQPSA